MIRETLYKVVNRQDLTEEEMVATMTEIMEGKACLLYTSDAADE